MKNRFLMIRRACAILVAAIWLVACGGMDTDLPAMTPDEEEALATSASEKTPGERETPGQIPVIVDQAGGEGGEESAGDGDDDGTGEDGTRCARICFKLAWCDEDSDLAECVANCESAAYDGVVKERVLSCVDEAKTCAEVAWCEDRIEACEEVCNVHDYCGYFQNGGCQSWCANEVWMGRLNWSTQGCVETAGAQDMCEELVGCGLAMEY